MGENEIRNLADSHAGIDEWKKAGFNELQVLEITKGNDNGVDISIYASPEYNSRQMKVIRMALEEGIDVSAMADPEYNYMQMEQIKEGLPPPKITRIVKSVKYMLYWEFDTKESYGAAQKNLYDSYWKSIEKCLVAPHDKYLGEGMFSWN